MRMQMRIRLWARWQFADANADTGGNIHGCSADAEADADIWPNTRLGLTFNHFVVLIYLCEAAWKHKAFCLVSSNWIQKVVSGVLPPILEHTTYVLASSPFASSMYDIGTNPLQPVRQLSTKILPSGSSSLAGSSLTCSPSSISKLSSLGSLGKGPTRNSDQMRQLIDVRPAMFSLCIDRHSDVFYGW